MIGAQWLPRLLSVSSASERTTGVSNAEIYKLCW